MSATTRRAPFTDARRVAPARRFCRACHRDKTGPSFSPGETTLDVYRCGECGWLHVGKSRFRRAQ